MSKRRGKRARVPARTIINTKSYDHEVKGLYDDIIEEAIRGLYKEQVTSSTKRKFKRNVSRLVKNSNVSREAVRAMDKHTKHNLKVLDAIATKKTTSPEFLDALKRTSKPVKDLIDNMLTKSVTGTAKKFNSMLDDLAADVRKGKFKDYKDGADAYAKKLRSEGITSIVTKGGKNYRLDTYAQMVLRSEQGPRHIAAQAEYANMNGFKENYLISTHSPGMMPRPGCAPYEGWIVSFEGAGIFTDLYGTEYEVHDVSETSYGEPAGQQGVHCRHSWDLMVDGFSLIRD